MSWLGQRAVTLGAVVLALGGVGCSSGAGEDAPRTDLVGPGGAPTAGNGAVDPLGGQPAGGAAAPTAGSGALDPLTGEPAGGAAAPTAGAGGSGDSGEGTPIPCDVASVVESNCHRCHGPTPIGGAVRLVTQEDWHKMSPGYGPNTLGDPNKRIYEIAQIRINDGSMPQGAPMPAPDLETLDSWLAAGAVAAPADDTCQDGSPNPTDPINPGGDDVVVGDDGSRCAGESAYEPLVAKPGETCYDFPVHAGINAQDQPFSVATGEAYHQWYYDVPWPPGTVGTRFGADFDNIQVLHHWLAFSSNSGNPDGTLAVNVLGTTLGEEANLIGGWAVGGCNVVFPDDMGLELPSSGKIMVQWHMYNNTGTLQEDATKVQFCTVPEGTRPNTGGLTWLGTENFNGPLGMGPGMHDFGGTCINDSPGPITIVAFWPHMHEIGINMRSEVTRAASGSVEEVFNKPFDFNYQIHYEMEPPVVLQPNDTIRSTCTFFNDTGFNVAFGQSTKAEMCYQFAFSYPAGALDNGVGSLIGALNTCWQPGE